MVDRRHFGSSLCVGPPYTSSLFLLPPTLHKKNPVVSSPPPRFYKYSRAGALSENTSSIPLQAYVLHFGVED